MVGLKNLKATVLLLPMFIGSVVFVFVTGGQILNPTNRDWLMKGDSATHYLGWEFFRNSPILQWPLGANPSYGNGFANSIVNTDSIPLAAFFFKMLDPLLPRSFQYFGIWILLCFILQAVFAWKLLALFIGKKSHLIIGTFFFSLSPVLLYRLANSGSGHIALVSQWLVLAALFLYFQSESPSWKWIVLICVSALIQPYLLAMVVTIWLVALLRVLSLKSTSYAFIARHFATALVLIFLTLWASGYFMFNSVATSGGFELYRWTLTSPLDPSLPGGFEWSRFLEDRGQLSGDGEGFSYLGSGVILLCIFVLVTNLILLFKKLERSKIRIASIIILVLILFAYGYWRVTDPSIRLFTSDLILALVTVFVFWTLMDILNYGRRHGLTRDRNIFILAVAALMTVYALTNRPGFNSTVLFEYPLKPPLRELVQTFRVGGRFFWPAGYLFLLFVIVTVSRKFSVRFASILLSICIVLQVVDSSNALKLVNARFTNARAWESPMRNPSWESIAKNHNELLVISALTTLDYPQWIAVTEFAERHNMATNTGYFARIDRQSFITSELELYKQVSSGSFKKNALYIIDDEVIWSELLLTKKDVTFVGELDGFMVLVP